MHASAQHVQLAGPRPARLQGDQLDWSADITPFAQCLAMLPAAPYAIGASIISLTVMGLI